VNCVAKHLLFWIRCLVYNLYHSKEGFEQVEHYVVKLYVKL